ncbi:MAG: hypothetical protein IPK10_08000 [Bacteroidetes bacterium]|nr:hypothetical protein [Bacteroidota bacterium]
MGATNSFYEQAQFRSEHFVTELLPDKFLLFLLWSLGFNKVEDIDRLVINNENPEDLDENKIYIEFRIGNNTLKEGSFGTYSKTGRITHQLSYKRLFNKRSADKNFLKLIHIYDDVIIGNASNKQLEVLIKQQVSEAYIKLFNSRSDFKSDFDSDNLISVSTALNETEQEKLVTFYKQQSLNPISPSRLQLLLKQLLFIDTHVEFVNKQLEYNYHPDGIGLDNSTDSYRLGKIVLDSYVKYTDVVANICHKLIPNNEIKFNSKVDYIRLERMPDESSDNSDVFIPFTNNTQDNFSTYVGNGINVQFPSSIFAYTIQLVKKQIELLYKLQNSNNYFSVYLEYGKEILLNVELFYSLDNSGKLVFVDEDYPDKIVATHSVKVKVFESESVIRIQTEETAEISIENYYHKYLKTYLEKKINSVLDVYLPVIYERKIVMDGNSISQIMN